ncbi:PhnD/SsuA/transferrin family substrate-binding protein [Haloechinothrix sp. LS1_15]|uniref:phosphate/phosphite/phosphonate ABC transporter substrate-binding protein n=1 Tax=Haloechinothrix sp. LS1_15 TaxID=2652248 RepID=UPI0029475CBD|nr:PhnD/SsuA/transferrin family substrate-binding protein [Haloechinothrix sp. LS1_15]MDV6012438.1 phosphate/phosphite/phosphonate ABC transporter substrate-binding protein [Haloechinothrix sp. LS1_15]
MALLLGAVAAGPNVVTVWSGLRAWAAKRGIALDFVLYSHYEHQAEELASGRIHAAWNSPLAWIRSARLADTHGLTVWPLVMRDSDQDVTSVILVRHDSPFTTLAELAEHTIGLGAPDSPQANLVPRHVLRSAGLVADENVAIRQFDEAVGLHGDDPAGEREAARALLAGQVDAAVMVDLNYLLLTREGTLPPSSTRVLSRTPPYDHANLTVSDAAPPRLVHRFGEMLLSMSYTDPECTPLFDLLGLFMWCRGRTCGYRLLEAAVDTEGFYSPDGSITWMSD